MSDLGNICQMFKQQCQTSCLPKGDHQYITFERSTESKWRLFEMHRKRQIQLSQRETTCIWCFMGDWQGILSWNTDMICRLKWQLCFHKECCHGDVVHCHGDRVYLLGKAYLFPSTSCHRNRICCDVGSLKSGSVDMKIH